MNIQMVLIIAALLLLSLISLSVNRAVLLNQETGLEGEATIVATSLAQSLIEEISMKKFDQKVVSGSVAKPDSLTPTVSLGPDAGETYPNFNDLDDYNGYTRTTATPQTGNLTLRSRVWYTNSALLGDSTFTRTFMKAITVVVDTNAYLKSPVTVRSMVRY
jgi:hypothetical protein